MLSVATHPQQTESTATSYTAPSDAAFEPSRSKPAESDAELLKDADRLMTEYMSHYDPSHDVLHVKRVQRMAKRLAESMQGTDVLVVELGALFHDLLDHKYSSGTAEVEERSARMLALLQKHGLEPSRADEVMKIVKNTGYSIEKKLRASGNWTTWHQNCAEYHCVQDADRLDAIGSMGIFRVAAYAEKTGAPLYHPDPAVGSAYSHFHDKLLSLKDTLKTPLGRQAGERRQQIMDDFIACADKEYALADF